MLSFPRGPTVTGISEGVTPGFVERVTGADILTDQASGLPLKVRDAQAIQRHVFPIG